MSAAAQGVNVFTPFKEFECILNSKVEPFPRKIESVIEIWKSLSQWKQQNSDMEYIIKIMDWAKLHTLNIVLTGKWKTFKADFEAKLLSEVEKTQNELMKISGGFLKKFQKLAEVIKNPWDDPVLANLLHDGNAKIGQEEIEFFCIETAYLVSVRLKKLCESQCEDLALNLVTAFMNCYNLSQTQNFKLNAPETHILFCFDIHVALLYRYNRMSDIVALFKKLTLEEGLQLIKRFTKKRVKILKVWRNYPEITFLASQVFVTAAVTKPFEESGTILRSLLEIWIQFSIEQSLVEKLENSIRRIIQAATAAQHIYICCEIIPEKFGTKLKPFTIELYIRALTTDMNNLESQKTDNEKEKVEATTKRLANGFYNLSDILKDNIQVSRECALTAFSLEPTLERLRKIEELARQSGFNVLDTGQLWECKLHPPVTEADDLCWVCNACGKWMCKPNLDLRLTTNFALNEALNFEQLGISSQLCDDLAVVLNGPRYHLLSWLLRWEDLHRLCEMYLNDMERTKNLVTELKFVDIDYSMFVTVKREPVDELSGIERGYEKFLYADDNNKIGSDSIEESNPEPLEVVVPKSEPNSIKSLRMFRHNNMKRNKPQVPQSVVESNNVAYNDHFNYSIHNNWPPHMSSFDNISQHLNKIPYNNMNGALTNRFPFDNSYYRTYSNSNHSTQQQYQQQNADGALDFSSTAKSNFYKPTHSENNTKSFNLGEFKSNLYKRKMSEEKSLAVTHPTCSSNPPKNFLHDMISYEYARSNGEIKRNKPVESSSSSTSTAVSTNSQPSVILNHKLPPVSQLLSSNFKTSHYSSVTDSLNFGKILGVKPINSYSNTHKTKDSNKKITKRETDIFLKDLLNSAPKADITYNIDLPIKKPGDGRDVTISPPKNDNHFFWSGSGGTNPLDLDIMSSLKRADQQNLTVNAFTPEKKLKLDHHNQFQVGPLSNGCSRNLDEERSKITEVLSAENRKLKKGNVDVAVQNENSSKNANCCLPTKSEHQKTVEADTKHDKVEMLQKNSRYKDDSSSFSKTLSDLHIPAIDSKEDTVASEKSRKIVDDYKIKLPVKSEPQQNITMNGIPIGQVNTIEDEKLEKIPTVSLERIDVIAKIPYKGNSEKLQENTDCASKTHYNESSEAKNKDKLKEENFKNVLESDRDLFKYANPSKPTSKELKIILHRLSTEVIKSFIPSYTGEPDHNCQCGCILKKKSSSRRKFCIRCEPRQKSRSSSPINYDKYSLRTHRNHERHENDGSRDFRSRRSLNGDISKKTGKNLKKYNKRNYLHSANHKENENDKYMRSSKKDIQEICLKKYNIDKASMNPRVVLERLPLDSDYVRSVLSNVPGLNDFEMLRPSQVNQIVNVVQISGGRSTSSVPVQNTQTSTQITPHIQRIGQPRTDKPEHNTNSEAVITSAATPTTTTTTTIKPSTSQSSTLINILSQQIIRPGQSNCGRTRTSPLINILSQQIIRPASTQVKAATNSVQGDVQNANLKAATTTTEQTNEVTAVKTITTTTKTIANTPVSGQGGTILQFICKSTLPKFQQAFGKTVYTNNSETTTETTTTAAETPATTTEVGKKLPVKTSPVNIQPIQGGVIYTRQMPVGQTINLIPPGRGQVFRIATSNSDQISLVKDTVIHSKMSALLAAALQGKQKSSEAQSDSENTSEEASGTRVAVARPTLVQNARIVKPVLQIPSNVIRTSPQSNLSSTTLEQLREFDMVYKQIKERSSTSTPAEAANTSESNENSQRISVTYLNQGQKYTQLSPVVVVSSYCNLQPAASPALSVTSQGSSSPCVTPAPTPSVPKVSSKSSKGKTVKTTTQASKSSPIPKPQQKPQEDEQTTQRIFDILAEYAEQLANSPDLNNKPAPRRRSNPPTNPSQNSKRKKSSSSKKSGQCSNLVSEADMEDHRTVGSEDSSCGVVQISVQEEEQTHVQNVTTESNDSTSSSRQQLILTEAGNNQTRNLIIADSSVGEALKMPSTAVLVPGNYIMPVSMVKGGQQIAVVSGGSKILATVPARSGPNMLLFQSFLNQNRNKTGVSTVKYSTIQPLSGISSQNITGVSGQPPVILPQNSHNLTAVTLGQPITLKKIDEADRVNTELLLAISQPRDNGNATSDAAAITHPDSTNSISSTVGNIELEETVVSDNSSEKIFHTYHAKTSTVTTPIATPVIAQTTCVAKEEAGEEQNSTQTITSTETTKSDSPKNLERVQSVLVTACTSNGPMLSHTPPRYRKPSETGAANTETATKEEFLHNGEKQNNNEQKHFQGNATYFQNKKKTGIAPRLDRELHQLCLQRKQAAIERELRLQKSLSEECEDLGVDEPSTSDLFPEADILFDSNHSPSFDQTSQDLVKRTPQDAKEENKTMTLFSDDDNSSSLRTDFLFESVEYPATATDLEYDNDNDNDNENENDQNRQLTNGQSSNASNESASSCEDHTLLQNCASMSDVTLNSPVSPYPYPENNPSSLNKYKFKYSNRRKGERHKQSSTETWAAEVSSSEDTTGSTELAKSSSHSPESCTNKRSHSVSCDDELSDGSSYKVVRVAISKSELLRDEESCEELHCDDDLDCSPSGRGARRSVKKMCSCCNGSQDGGASRKRPGSRPHTPAAPHKKAFLNKKR